MFLFVVIVFFMVIIVDTKLYLEEPNCKATPKTWLKIEKKSNQETKTNKKITHRTYKY